MDGEQIEDAKAAARINCVTDEDGMSYIDHLGLGLFHLNEAHELTGSERHRAVLTAILAQLEILHAEADAEDDDNEIRNW